MFLSATNILTMFHFSIYFSSRYARRKFWIATLEHKHSNMKPPKNLYKSAIKKTICDVP